MIPTGGYTKRLIDVALGASGAGMVTLMKLGLPVESRHTFPYRFYLPAAILMIFLRGSLAGFTTAFLGFWCGLYYFVAPYFSFEGKWLWANHLTVQLEILGIVGLTAWLNHRENTRRAELLYRDRVLALATHELNNPISTILIATALAKQNAEKRDEPEIVRKLEVVDRQVKRIKALVGELTDAASLHAGVLTLRCETWELCAIVQEVIERFHNPLIRFCVQEPVYGLWDEQRIDQILTNLLSNALKYGRGQPIDVEVHHEHAYARLVVRDRGIGMTRENQLNAFEPYKRFGYERTSIDGLGLGLWIVAEIVRSKKGHITVSSQPNRGSTFSVLLPTNRCAEFQAKPTSTTSAYDQKGTPSTCRTSSSPSTT